MKRTPTKEEAEQVLDAVFTPLSPPTKSIKKLIRPVKCHFCHDPMFYSGDERHEPEIRVTVEESIGNDTVFYAHVRCWNAKIG